MFLNFSKTKKTFKIFCVLALGLFIFPVYPWQTNVAQALITCTPPQTCQNIAGLSDAALSALECNAAENCKTGAGTETWVCCRPRPPEAGDGGTGGGAGGVRAGLGEAKAGLPQFKIEEKIGDIISTILGFVGILFLVLMIAGGLMWMTAGGAEEKLGKAKKLIASAVVGMIIVFSAYAITYFVTTTLLGGG